MQTADNDVTPAPPRPQGTRLGAIARWSLTIGLLAFTLMQAPPSQWLPFFKGINFLWFLGAALCMAAIVLNNSFKWYVLLRLQDMHPAYLRVLYHYAVGYFFNSFITGTGDIKRATDMGREEGQMSPALASVLAERWTGVIGQISLAGCTLSALLLHTPEVWPIALCAILIVVGLALFYLWFENADHLSSQTAALERLERLHKLSLGRWILRVRQAMAIYKGHRAIWWACMALSFVGPLLLVLIHILLCQALGFPASIMAMVVFVPTISVFAQLPITINGFGLQDYFMVTLFANTFTPAQALALSMVFHALRLSVGAVGGLLYATCPNLGLKIPQPARAESELPAPADALSDRE